MLHYNEIYVKLSSQQTQREFSIEYMVTIENFQGDPLTAELKDSKNI